MPLFARHMGYRLSDWCNRAIKYINIISTYNRSVKSIIRGLIIADKATDFNGAQKSVFWRVDVGLYVCFFFQFCLIYLANSLSSQVLIVYTLF